MNNSSFLASAMRKRCCWPTRRPISARRATSSTAAAPSPSHSRFSSSGWPGLGKSRGSARAAPSTATERRQAAKHWARSTANVCAPQVVDTLRDGCPEVGQHSEDATMILLRLGQPELSEDRADVRLYGSFREPELLRDARVRTPFRHQSEDLAFSRS